MSRTKLGRANMDGVPAEELILAEMIANAEEHGLSFQTFDTGMENVEGMYVPCGERACAVGAYLAFKLAPHLETLYTPYNHLAQMLEQPVTFADGVWEGNDGHEPPGWATASDLVGYNIGAAYRAYHLEAD